MDIAEWRQQIDALDRQLVEILNERCRCAQEIGHLKRGQALPVYEPDREKTIYDNVARLNQGPLSTRALRHIYERIIDEMRAIQKYEALTDDTSAAGKHSASAGRPGGDSGR
ncbi:MAG: chorismate mutase [Terriglobales bacterium]